MGILCYQSYRGVLRQQRVRVLLARLVVLLLLSTIAMDHFPTNWGRPVSLHCPEANKQRS